MWIDVPLLIISIFLMIREFFPKIEDYYRKWKRIVHIILIVGMFVLSIINIVRTNNENQNLIDTAKETLSKIDSVYVGQVKSDSTLRQSVIDIKKVDSVLGNVKDTIQYQVKLLDSSIGKSKELVRLETLDFESKKTEFSTTNLGIEVQKSDTTKFRIVSTISNKGRKGEMKYSVQISFLTDESGNLIKFLIDKSTLMKGVYTSFEMDSGTMTKHQSPEFPISDIIEKNRVLFHVYSVIYKDLITNKEYKETEYFKKVLPFKDSEVEFVKLNPDEIKLVNHVLDQNQYYQLLNPKSR